MPELPEVETTRRGLAPHVERRRIAAICLRRDDLRWPIPAPVRDVAGERVISLTRRAKWLVWQLESGALLWHLGMSGSFRVWTPKGLPPAGPHDHVDLAMAAGRVIRFTDPRRFGALLWSPGDDPLAHPRLNGLGPEPFSEEFSGQRLWQCAHGRRGPVKSLIMDAGVVVGVGNIYACEALFLAGIHPRRSASRISLLRYGRLAAAIVDVLGRAIEEGGTSLRDFTAGDGRPGYFGQALLVYGREGEPCASCGGAIRRVIIGQRSTFYCARCQR